MKQCEIGKMDLEVFLESNFNLGGVFENNHERLRGREGQLLVDHVFLILQKFRKLFSSGGEIRGV
jgi:hypothetical protein